jgi:hypothetical protein
MNKKQAARIMGCLGGSATSEKKTQACKDNWAIARANKKRKALERLGNISSNDDRKKVEKTC